MHAECVVYVAKRDEGGERMAGVGKCVSFMDSRVLWRGVMSVCEGRKDKAG
jgi:hypothetical protein